MAEDFGERRSNLVWSDARWPDIWAVVVDAVLDEVTKTTPVQQRATARESFKVSMRLVAKSFRGHHGKILRPLIERAQIDETLRKTLADRWLVARRKISCQIVLRGIASGELREGLDPISCSTRSTARSITGSCSPMTAMQFDYPTHLSVL